MQELRDGLYTAGAALVQFQQPFRRVPDSSRFGITRFMSRPMVLPNRELSLEDGAIEPFTKPQFEWWRTELKKFARREGIPMNKPFAELTVEQQSAVIEGHDGFDGVKGLFDWLETKKYKLHVR